MRRKRDDLLDELAQEAEAEQQRLRAEEQMEKRRQRQEEEELEKEEMETESKDIMFNDPDIITKTMKCLGMSYTPKEDIFHYKSYGTYTF